MALKLSTKLCQDMLDPAGKGFAESLNLGAIYLYGSPRPASADDVETGALLMIITVDKAAWTITDGTNGLTFDSAVANVIEKAAAENWQGVGLAQGTAVWGRLYAFDASGTVVGASTTKARMDFSVGAVGADMIIPNPLIEIGATTTVDEFELTLPNGE